jgi:hypothetical protein
MEGVKVLRELVAVENLRAVASSRAACEWCPPGSCVSLRTILHDLLSCVDDDGVLLSAWHEERPDHVGRRYSGCPAIPAKATGELARFKRLLAEGVNPSTVGKSLFAFPGYVRNLSRAGLADLYILDLANCHPCVTLRRHPTMAGIAAYVKEREKTLASVPTPRAAAKELFIRMLYGGKALTWCQEHGVDPASLPPIVRAFERDVAKVRAADGGDPGVVQYLRNTEAERKAIDSIESLLTSRGAWIHAWEHDGLAFSLPGADIRELTQACSSCCSYVVTVTRPPSLAECMSLLREKSGLDDWRPGDGSWEEREALVARARVEPLTSHALFAKVILNEPRVSDEIPWPVRDLFRLCPSSKELHWYNVDEGVWCEAAGGNGSQVLKELVTTILQRRLRSYSLADKRHGHERFRADALRWDLGCQAFRQGVEACLRSHLIVQFGFMLDPESSRQFLNFGKRAWDREAEAWVDTRPDMLISRSVGWEFEEFANPEMERVDRALAAVRREQDERGLGEPSVISEETQAELDAAALHMPELAFFLTVTREWETAVYLLTHLARGVFAVPIAEGLFVRSSGRSGKDVTANLLCALLGSYGASISCDALCAITSPDAPSPTFASLRARRFVAVREVADQKILSSVFKRLVDPVSELQGRNLYDAPIRFKPHYLCFFCSNAPLAMTTMDAAVKARTAVVEYGTVFVPRPSEANHANWKDMTKATVEYRPGLWWLLRRVFHHLLKDRPLRNVAPVPEACMDAVALDCRARSDDVGEAFLASKIVPAKGPSDATPACDVEDAVAREMAIDRAAVGLWLQGRGFERARSKAGPSRRNMHFYRFNFTVGGVKSLSPHYVRVV